MRKALLSLLLVLAIILIILFLKSGLTIGTFQIYGFEDINQKDKELTQAISDANKENDNYKTTISKLEQDVTELTNAKKTYLDLIAQSTESEIKQATQTKTYTIEYLWSEIGNLATAQNINLKMEVVSSTLSDLEYRNLNFTADGEYLAIVQFMYNLENDSNLDFTIDSFNMTLEHATFTVKDVKIIRENTTTDTQVDLDTTNDSNSDNNTNSEDKAEEGNTDTTNDEQESNTNKITNEVTNTTN